MNLVSILRCHADSRADKPAIEYDKTVINYGELWQRVEAFASCLRSQGVTGGDRVGLALQDHPGHLILHYALARIGAVILPVDHRWTVTEKSAAAATFKAKLVITEPGDEALPGIETITFEPHWEQHQPDTLPAIPDAEGMALLISLSSGTTGKPKGAVVTHEQMYERFVSQWVTIGFNSEDRFVSLTPLFFGAGRSFSMSFLAAGATVILDPPPHTPEQLAAAVTGSRASATFLVPTLLRRLLPLANDKTLLLPDLKRLLISGAVLHPAEAEHIQRLINPNLIGYYASSEGGGISVLSSNEFADCAHTVGRPTFRTEVDIVDSDGQKVTPGDTGRLRYRGPGVAKSFIDSDGNETSGDKHAWFYPGDLAAILPQGHIVLRGRDKDMINRGGVNIYPSEVEAVLMRHPGISEVAVLGKESTSLGETVIAFVVPVDTANDDLNTLGLDDHCRQHLATYKIPEQFFSVVELPKMNSGKIDKQALANVNIY